MHFKALVSSFSFVCFIESSLASSDSGNVHNANHIFNAIHSSMRQWGSSLNHNGMSLFLATVPEGTQLYHGTSRQEPVKGMEWLAFEPEHALMFSRPRGPPPGERPPKDGEELPKHGEVEEVKEDNDEDRDEWDHFGPPPPPPPPPGHPHGPPIPHGPPPPPPHHPHEPPKFHSPPPHDDLFPLPPPGPHRRPFPGDDFAHPPPFRPHHGPPSPPPGHPHEPLPHHGHPPPPPYHPSPPPHHPEGPPPPHKRHQQPLTIPPSEAPIQYGYLHTYAPKRPLNLLYIDGMSAGKTSNGTLDTQDMLLLNLSSNGPHGPMGGEFERARGLCNLSSTAWEGKIDGVLRMELGFEIILCDFERDLEVKDIIAVSGSDSWGRPGGGWRYQRAVADRYHSIGGPRVIVDYDKFVTVFKYKGLDLWKNDVNSDYPMPRLQNVDDSMLGKIRDAITDMILSSGEDQEGIKRTTNWQQVADMLVQRYSEPLHYLHTNPSIRARKEDFAQYLAALLRPFIDYTDRNSTIETQRCIAQAVPALPHPPFRAAPLAHRSIHAIAGEICSTLLTVFDVSVLSMSRSLAPTSPPPSHALDLVDTLVSYLQWATWKECGTCADNEICIIPIWPMGTFEEHANPKCKSADEYGWRGNYWGHFGRPPPGKDRPGEREREDAEWAAVSGGRGRGRGPPRHAQDGGRGAWHAHEHDHEFGRGRKGCRGHEPAHRHRHGRHGVWGRLERAARWIGGWIRMGGVGWRH